MLPKTAKGNYIAGLDHGIGGGGWVAPRTYDSAKKFSFENSFGRYGGGKGNFGESRSIKLFGESGSKSFSISSGAGFAGRAHPGLASMETFHRYKQYKAMMKYRRHGRCFHGYCGRGIYYRRHCIGGCYGSSFCDFGACRCHNGYYAYHGSCWNNGMSSEEQQILETQTHQGLKPSNPFQACNDTSDCNYIDMNLVCATDSKTCQCREDMKWNKEELECQVYIDVDCSIFESSFYPHKESKSDSDLNPIWDGCKDDPKKAIEAGYAYHMNSSSSECVYVSYDDYAENSKTDYSYYSCQTLEYMRFCPKACGECDAKWDAEYEGLDISIVQLPSYNLTKQNDGSLDLNITNIEPGETLSTSYLTKLDLKKAKAIDIKKEFCLEIKAISTKYEEPERIRQYLSKVSL